MPAEFRPKVEVPTPKVGALPQTVPKGTKVRRRPVTGSPRAEHIAVRERLLAAGALAGLAVPTAVAAEVGPATV